MATQGKHKRFGVLLINMGGPSDLEEVESYLFRLFSDPMVIPIPLGKWFQEPFARFVASRRKAKSRELYKQIGGQSPLLKISQEQAQALEAQLVKNGIDVEVRVAMSYSQPFIPEMLDYFTTQKLEHLVVLPLYPQYCKATSGTAIARVHKWQEQIKPSFSISVIEQWYDWPAYIETMAQKIHVFLAPKPDQNIKQAVLFSAHSIPVNLVNAGDPFVHQTEQTVERIMKRITSRCFYQLAYQSKSSGPVRWVGPDIRHSIRKAGDMHLDQLTFVPLSFVAENLETLQEIDREYIPYAKTLGIKQVNRVPCLNVDPEFIQALALLVTDHLERISLA